MGAAVIHERCLWVRDRLILAVVLLVSAIVFLLLALSDPVPTDLAVASLTTSLTGLDRTPDGTCVYALDDGFLIWHWAEDARCPELVVALEWQAVRP